MHHSPIELRINGLIAGEQYQITTYHHSRTGTGTPHDGLRIDVVESDGAGGVSVRTNVHSNWQWSTGTVASLSDVTRVTSVAVGSAIVDTTFRGFSYQVALRFYMSGSGGAYRNLLPVNGISIQLQPPTAPRGPSEVNPTLDIPYQMKDATLVTQLWNETYPFVEFQLQEQQRVQMLEKI